MPALILLQAYAGMTILVRGSQRSLWQQDRLSILFHEAIPSLHCFLYLVPYKRSGQSLDWQNLCMLS